MRRQGSAIEKKSKKILKFTVEDKNFIIFLNKDKTQTLTPEEFYIDYINITGDNYKNIKKVLSRL